MKKNVYETPKVYLFEFFGKDVMATSGFDKEEGSWGIDPYAILELEGGLKNEI